MKSRLIISFYLLCSEVISHHCFGHEIQVHAAITESAAQSSSGLITFLADRFGITNAPFLEKPLITEIISDNDGGLFQGPIGWMISGSRTEDNTPRYKNHFYDPTKNPPIGLTDGLDFWGIPSFTWASAFHGGGTLVQNVDTWGDARNYEIAGLTNVDRVVRGYNLAHMLYTLGRVMHLNEDLSQPDHVRNDNHTTLPIVGSHPFGPSWIEPYGLANFETNKQWFNMQPHGWSYWQNCGFSKLKDFWNRGFYDGTSSQPLVDNEDGSRPAGKLGLAEFSNGNFLGEDVLYKEYFNLGDKHYFGFPSLESSTDYRTRVPIGTGVSVSYLKNGKPINRIRISKVADGVDVANHSMLLYLGTSIPRRGGAVTRVSSTINDPTVLQEYHSILIPKAVEYSAGLLDYFFRGTLSAKVTGYNASSQRFTNVIINTSGQTFSGGNFSIYQDGVAGLRTLLVSNIFTGNTLPNANSITMTFPGTLPLTNDLTVVYQGTIGSDPVDANIAIAVTAFHFTTNWHSSFEGTGGTFSAGTDFAEVWHVDSGSVDDVSNAGWQAQDGNYSLDLNGGGPGTISAYIPTVIGQQYRLSFYYSHNPDGGTADPSAEVLFNSTHLATVDSNVANTEADMQWQLASFDFTATTSPTTLTFKSLTSDVYGIALDNIRLTAVSGQ